MIPEFKSIQDLLRVFPNELSCIEHLEDLRWNGEIVSPFDPTSKVYVCKGKKYRCKNTGKYFNVKTGTIFEDTKIPLQKWFLALYIFSSHKKGISSHQLARDITVTQKTAWFMLHRLRSAFGSKEADSVLGESNVVEIDETYVGGAEKNKHKSRKTEGSQGRSTKAKKPVLGMLERGGGLVTFVVDDTKQSTVEPIIHENVKSGSEVVTDEWIAYRNLGTTFSHEIIRHGAREFVRGKAHTNSIEGFWSHFKRMLDGTYHNVSFKHLQCYVTEQTLRYNTRKLKTHERFSMVLKNTEGRLSYKQLTNG